MEPAAVGPVAVEAVSGADAEGLTVEGPPEDVSAALEDGVWVASDDRAAEDDFSLGVLDAAALEDGTVTVLEEDVTRDGAPVGTENVAVLRDRGIDTTSEDDGSGVLIEVGSTTMPVGVTDDSREESKEVSRENVGRG